jgi:putative membrane protein
MTDLELAVGHHLMVFALVAIIAVEFALLRPGLSGVALRRIAGLDAAYGIVAGLIVAIGLCRVYFGIKGADFYHSNPWFWSKMAAFAVIGGLSIIPTVSFIKWRRAGKTDPGFAPLEEKVRRVRNFIAAELVLLPVVIICAATMARYGSF